jgi:glutamate-ammonia-ligase adenylyltransferase
LGSPGAEYLVRELAARSEVLAKALSADVGDPALRSLQRFLAAASTEDDRVRVTLENVPWIERALPAFEQSTLAMRILARHPEDVRALFGGEASRDESSISDRLRIESRHCVLRSVGRSLLEKTPIWEILAEHSLSFDAILQKALLAAEAPDGFAVFAAGRLGTCELDVVSDADLLFVRSADCDAETAERCARSLVAMLSGYTREGSVISVDTRLRPHGSAGELVSSTRQLAQYFETEAKAWEALAFSKLRLIAGTERLAESMTVAIRSLQMRFAAMPEFVAELVAMRKRLKATSGGDSFKTAIGGVYDLDFVVGLLEARSAVPATARQLKKRLHALIENELLTAEQGGTLLHAAELFRRVDHAIRVVEGCTRRWLPESDVSRATVETLVECSDLDGVLRAEMRNARDVFTSFFGD